MAQTCQAKQMSCSASIYRTCSKTAIWLRAKNWIETYQNASKPQMDWQLCVCGSARSLRPQISEHSLPRLLFLQGPKTKRSCTLSNALQFPCLARCRKDPPLWFHKGNKLSFFRPLPRFPEGFAQVTWRTSRWHVASFQWISPQFCGCSFALNCSALKNNWENENVACIISLC